MLFDIINVMNSIVNIHFHLTLANIKEVNDYELYFILI